MRAAHGAEVGRLRAFLRQRFVVEGARLFGIEAEVELVLPAELEAGLAQRVVAFARAGETLGQIGRVGGDLVGDHALAHVVLVRQAEVLLRRDVAEHRAAEPADHRRADRAGDVVVAGRDVGRQRPERVERRLGALLQLELHVFLDELHRHVAGAFDHHLAIVLPRLLRQFAERGQFRQLRLVVRVRARAGTQAVAEREGDVVGLHDLANLVEVRVEKILLVMREAPLGEDRAAAADDAAHARARSSARSAAARRRGW